MRLIDPIATLDPATRLLHEVRSTRFAVGVCCPRCGSRTVIRWGRFSGRQRYRCRACTRTFSDLTATPFAYTKRLADWPAYIRLMRRSMTLRTVASELGIHLSTSFRWRHRTLSALLTGDRSVLDGFLEVREILLPFSRKGERGLPDPRVRGLRIGRRLEPPVRVLLVCARNGLRLCRSLHATGLRECLEPHLARGAIVMSVCGRFGRFAVSARRTGCRHLTVERRLGPVSCPTMHHIENVTAYASRFLFWLDRFRGVATRYLDNYLIWRVLVDRDETSGWQEQLLCRLGNQHFPRTEPERSGGATGSAWRSGERGGGGAAPAWPDRKSRRVLEALRVGGVGGGRQGGGPGGGGAKAR